MRCRSVQHVRFRRACDATTGGNTWCRRPLGPQRTGVARGRFQRYQMTATVKTGDAVEFVL